MKTHLIERTATGRVPMLEQIRAKNRQQAVAKLKALCFTASKIVGYGFCLKEWNTYTIKHLN